jgi:uncharacterized protein (DUF885 family)
VVDPGLHVFGWTRQQAIDYMLVHVPESATSYMVGRLEIERLRAEAEARLGKRFDIRASHDQVLENGAVPLSLLRSHVEAWLHSRSHPVGGC